MSLTRRQLLASGSAVALAAMPGVVAAGAERAAEFDVEVDYPEEWLQRYRPAFVADYQTMQRSEALYAHRARHADREHDVAYYWHRLTHQDGLPLLGADGHLYDHEPVAVFVDDDGNVDRVTYTAYHHFQHTTSGFRLGESLRARETSDPTHVQLEIIDPWHHYGVRADPSDEDVTFVDVEGDSDASHLDTWETRGIFDSTAAEAIYDPWTIESRGSWWDEGTWDYRVASLWRQVSTWTGVGGREEADI